MITFIETKELTLKTPISTSDTQIVLSNAYRYDGTTISSGDFGDYQFGTLDPKKTNQEGLKLTFVSSASGELTCNVTRALKGTTPYSTGGTAYTHEAGAVFVFANSAALFNELSVKKDDETWTGLKSVPTPTAAAHIATKAYADARETAAEAFATDADAPIIASVTVLDTAAVHKAGIETITGVKTFSANPIVPDATAAQHPYTLAQAEAATAAAATDATATAKGVVEIATQAQVTAGTATGETGATLVVTPTHTTTTSAGAPDAGKVVKLNASGLINASIIENIAPRSWFYGSTFGDSTTRFDIVKTGSTVRYTWDGTGLDPFINTKDTPLGATVVINGQNFSAGNNLTAVITLVGTNYFEITNASGVTESDKTLGTGSIQFKYVLLDGLPSVDVQVFGGGSSGPYDTPVGVGVGGGYARSCILGSSADNQLITVGIGGALKTSGAAGATNPGGQSSFGALVVVNGITPTAGDIQLSPIPGVALSIASSATVLFAAGAPPVLFTAGTLALGTNGPNYAYSGISNGSFQGTAGHRGAVIVTER